MVPAHLPLRIRGASHCATAWRSIMQYAGTICPGRGTIAAAVLVLLAALVAGYPSARADDWEIETKDGIRSAIVMPAPQASAPTLVVLHGATISADLTARWSGFAEAAAAHGFAAVFPEGIYKLWNDARGDKLSSSDDVGFLRRLNEELVTRGVADPARIYIAGISNGGMMTLRMLCEAPELYAGAATVIANMPAEAGASCRLTKPMPVDHVQRHGRSARTLPGRRRWPDRLARRGLGGGADGRLHCAGQRLCGPCRATGRQSGRRPDQGDEARLGRLQFGADGHALPRGRRRAPAVRTHQHPAHDLRPRHHPGLGARDHHGQVRQGSSR